MSKPDAEREGVASIIETRVSSAPAVRDELVQLEPPALLGGKCGECGRLSFPLERFCAHCGALDPQRCALATTGTIYSYAVVRFAPPGYAGSVPYAVGVVELEPGIRVASTLIADPIEALQIAAPVRFELLEVPTDDGVVLSYAYVQEEGA